MANGGRLNAITKEQYADFELEAVWKLRAGANGGIVYRDDPNQFVLAGNEYQIADHHLNPAIYPPENQTASLYGLIAPLEDVMYPSEQWNTTRIVCLGTKIEHWLNQRKVLEYDTASESFIALKRSSMFGGKDLIGTHQNNFLLLQSINGELSFRSIRIRRLTTGEVDLLARLDVSKRDTGEMKWQLIDGVLTGKGIATSSTRSDCGCGRFVFHSSACDPISQMIAKYFVRSRGEISATAAGTLIASRRYGSLISRV